MAEPETFAFQVRGFCLIPCCFRVPSLDWKAGCLILSRSKVLLVRCKSHEVLLLLPSDGLIFRKVAHALGIGNGCPEVTRTFTWIED